MQIIDFNTNGYSFKPGGGGSSAKLGTTNLYPDTVSNVYMAEDEGLDGWSSVIVEGVDASIDGNILPENIKKGVKILRVEGTLEEGDYDEIYDEIVNLNAGDVEGTYSYYDGHFDVEGLKAIGWTDTDIKYLRDNAPHYAWEDSDYIVSEELKDAYNQHKDYTVNDMKVYLRNNNIEAKFFPKVLGGTGRRDFYEFDTLTYVPLFDTTGNTQFDAMFYLCPRLETVPPFDSSNGTEFGGLFYGDKSLKTVPWFDTSKSTWFGSMFDGCTLLQHIPEIDTHLGQSFESMFRSCSSLLNMPQLDTTSATTLRNTFYGCSKLKSIPDLNTPNVDDFYCTFRDCSSLLTVPEIDTSRGLYFTGMFEGCSKLKVIPSLNTYRGNSFSSMFSGCNSLERIEGLNLTNCTSTISANWMPSSNTTLTYIRFNGMINTSVSFANLRALDFDSYKSILTAASHPNVSTSSKTLTFYSKAVSDPNGELAALVSACTSKGWTITGLTLN